jgi:Na+-transporting NADH:ubiquinone oxidoreductase subunit B
LAVLLPAGAPPWQVVLGASFGVVVAEQVFGGRGYGFLNPAVAGLAFLSFSFPSANYNELAALHWLAVLPAALVLVRAKLLSWRILASVALGYGSVAYATGNLLWPGAGVLGSMLFALVFLACDPVAASATNPGRWIYGLLIGVLLGLDRDGSKILPILVGQIFASLIDQGVVRLGARFRAVRHA